MPHRIGFDFTMDDVIHTALEVAERVSITKENSIMEIPIAGKLILNFSGEERRSIIIEIDEEKNELS